MKAKQLKALQYLISASCYISVLESSHDKIRNLREFYHGDGNDIMGKANDLNERKFSYRVLSDIMSLMMIVFRFIYSVNLAWRKAGVLRNLRC